MMLRGTWGLSVLAILASTASAQAPRQMGYQGRLTTPAGVPIVAEASGTTAFLHGVHFTDAQQRIRTSNRIQPQSRCSLEVGRARCVAFSTARRGRWVRSATAGAPKSTCRSGTGYSPAITPRPRPRSAAGCESVTARLERRIGNSFLCRDLAELLRAPDEQNRGHFTHEGPGGRLGNADEAALSGHRRLLTRNHPSLGEHMGTGSGSVASSGHASSGTGGTLRPYARSCRLTREATGKAGAEDDSAEAACQRVCTRCAGVSCR